MSRRLYTTQQAAEILGMSVESVRLRFQTGTIPGAFRDRGRWYVAEEGLESYRLQGMPEPPEAERITLMPRHVLPVRGSRAA